MYADAGVGGKTLQDRFSQNTDLRKSTNYDRISNTMTKAGLQHYQTLVSVITY